MLEKLGIPENCIKNLNIPLNKIFSDEDIDEYQIQECKLYASLNYNLLDLQKPEKTDTRYNEIHFVFIKIKKLFAHSDLHRIVRQIYRAIKYQVIVLIDFDGMYKFAAGYITPGKTDSEINLITHFLFTKWLFADEENEEVKRVFSDIAKALKEEKNIQILYKTIYKTISRIIEEGSYSKSYFNEIIEYITKLIGANECFENEIKSSVLSLKYYRHSDGKKYQIDKDDVGELYPAECVWHVINNNEQVKAYCKKNNMRTITDLKPASYGNSPIEYPENYNSDNIFIQRIEPIKVWDDIPNEDSDYIFNQDHLYQEDFLNTDEDSDDIEKWYSIIDEEDLEEYESDDNDYDDDDDEDDE